MKLLTFLFTLLMIVSTANAQWLKYEVETDASFRGLDVVSENVIWASGTGGTVVRTIDGGENWDTFKVAGAEKLDFRDIEAFDENTAYILSIGNGEASRIYKTTDGGENWKLQFTNKDEKAFFDSIAFWDEKNGMAQSDPVEGKYVLYRTTDGENWTKVSTINMPSAKEGEAAFAASGTCIITEGKNRIWLITGGMDARVFYSKDRGKSWKAYDTPIVSGTAGSGIFSIAMRDKKNGVIVGGNYEKPDEANNNLAFTSNGGKTWTIAKGLNGYRSGVAYIDEKRIIAVGSNGSDISSDGGKTWKNLDKGNYNAVQSLGEGLTWAVGPKGMVAKLLATIEINNSVTNFGTNLRNRSFLFNSYFETAQYEKMWEMISTRLQVGNDNNKTEYISYIQAHGFSTTKIKSEIIAVETNGKTGKVKVKMSVWLDDKGERISEIREETWVFENNNWFYDTHKVLKQM